MKTTSRFPWARATAAALIATFAVAGTSCMTTYDSYGRPVQSVDPGVAVAGVAAAGLIGYALADDGHKHRHHHRRHYDRPHYGHGGYYGDYHGGHRRGRW